MMQIRVSCVMVAAFLLVACGGGGGGSQSNIQATVPPNMQAQVNAQDVQGSSPGSTRAAMSQVATSLPAFGSITQSVNRDGVSGISSDRASITLDEDREILTLRVDRQSGTDLVVTSDAHLVASILTESSPLPDHTHVGEGLLVNYDTDETTIAYVGVSWDDDDLTDYLAGGYWLHFSGDVLGSNFTVDEAGAFVDGPEIDIANRPTMPSQGSATYLGEAEGLYGGYDASSGESEIGLFNGDMELTADFSAGTIGGCIGCGSGVYVNFDSTPTGYRVRLGATNIKANGVYRGTSVSLEHPTIPITSSSGTWGGMFSNKLNSEREPRLTAGTVGGQATSDDGSKAAFVGAHYAVAQ